MFSATDQSRLNLCRFFFFIFGIKEEEEDNTVVGEGLSPPSSLLRVKPSPTSSRSRSLRSSAPKVSSWVCRSEEGLVLVLSTDAGVNGSSFRAVGEGKPPEMGGSPPKVTHIIAVSLDGGTP